MYEINVSYEDGMKATFEIIDMDLAVVIFREHVKVNKNLLVELKYSPIKED